MAERSWFPTKPYFRWGMLGIAGAALLLGFDMRGHFAPWLEDVFLLQVISGILLAGLVAFQFALLAVRRFGRVEDVRRHATLHRISGLALIVVFAAHAVRFGYAWTSTLSLVFLLAAGSGLMNRETMRYRSKTLYLLWFGLHVGLSAALLPLAILHIWTALAFK